MKIFSFVVGGEVSPKQFYAKDEVDRLMTPATLKFAEFDERFTRAENSIAEIERRYSRIFEKLMETISQEL